MSDQPFQAPSPESLSELLPHYDVEFFIAQGGMGAVYKGRQLSLDRDIAIKVLPHEVGESEEFRESFISEAKAMARLNHSNLLGVFDYGTVDGMPYIVMEYVEGGSLHQAAYNQAVEASQAVAIVKGICDGLTHAHEHGIVHRDIKPSNILLTVKAEPKVADFGLAHAADSDKPGLVMGTPGYTAPEVFQDPNQAGALADIYSVGVILHQLLTGIDPAGSMEPPSQPCGSLRLDTIWRKATHIDPAQRYASVAAMSADLDKWMVAKQKSAVVATPSPLHAARRPVTVPADDGGGWMGKLAFIGGLAVIAFLGYQLLQDDKEEVKDDIVERPGTETPVTTPDPITPPEPVSLPSEDHRPTYEPDPEPIDTDADEEPVMVNEEDDEVDAEPSENLEPGDPELRERAIGLIGDARRKRDKELSGNVSALEFALESLSRGVSGNTLDLMEEAIGDIVENRIRLTYAVSSLPEKMEDTFKDYLGKEESIDERHRSDLTRIRDAYVTRLKGAAADAEDEALKERLEVQAEEADDLDDWIALLSPEDEGGGGKSANVGAGSFVGNWYVHTNDDVGRWTAHENGRLEIVGEKWEAFWEILTDGSLEVTWTGKKKPYMLKSEGEDWVGKSPFGHPVRLKPGDW